MKFVSWNVNGLRAAMKKGFLDFLQAEDPDVLAVQETKASPEQVALDLPRYHAYWSAAEKKGYSGVLLLTKPEPKKVSRGLEGHPEEGRVITAEYDDWFLVNCYTPNSQRGLARLDYRTREWDVDFLRHLKKLVRRKPVILCGDLNVAHKEIDLAHPESNRRNAGFTDEERAGFDALVEAGFVDTFREFEQGGGHYTWWSYIGNARAKNVGWRIDYFCISKKLRPRLQAARILPNVLGSDHCPVVMELA